MTWKEYTDCCYKTLSVVNNDNELHCAIGLSTEANEILDAYKKDRFYGREIDKKNIKEEVGDMLWYIAILLKEIDYHIEDAMVDNVMKLEKRYPDGFKDVLVRNQEQELSHIGE